MPEQKPSVGSVVHYVSYGTPGGEYGKECRAAIVTAVNENGTIGLAVFNPTGMFFNRVVMYDEGSGKPGDPNCPEPHAEGPLRYCACGWTEPGHKGGTWHWPERV